MTPSRSHCHPISVTHPSQISDLDTAQPRVYSPLSESLSGERMAIIEEYDSIAKRLRELQTSSAKSADEITHLEKWRDLARETARVYVENGRRRGVGNPSRRSS